MALFVRDMCTAAVPGHANFRMAILVHRIPPAARTCILMHSLCNTQFM